MRGRPFFLCMIRWLKPPQAASFLSLPKRRRPNTATAPAPNSSSIGGAGTWVPLVVLVVDPVLEFELELLELLLLEELDEDDELDELELELVELEEPDVLEDPEVEPQCP